MVDDVKLIPGHHYNDRLRDRFEIVLQSDTCAIDDLVEAKDRLLRAWEQMASPNGALRAFNATITAPQVRVVFGRSQVFVIVTCDAGGAKAIGVGARSKHGPCPKCYSRAVHRCKTGECVHCEWCPHTWVPRAAS
jgi:hypothetical protein